MTTTDEDDDFALLDRWDAGDREAGRVLVKPHIEALRGFFYNEGRSDADDLLQKTLTTFFEKRSAFRRESTFRTYLFGIANNVLSTARRTQKRDLPRQGELDPDIHDSKLGGRSATGNIAKEEKLRQVLVAIRQLPVPAQKLLQLYYLEEQTAKEIATALEVAEGTVRSRIRRAEAQLREHIAKIPAARLRASTLKQLEDWEASLKGKG